MPDFQVSFGTVDSRDDKAWGGFTVYNVITAPTTAQLTALAGALNAASDGLIYCTKVTQSTKTGYDITSLGESFVEYTGIIQFRHITTGAKYTMSIHAISDENVVKPVKSGRGSVVPYVDLTTVQAVRTAFAPCIGAAVNDLEVIQNIVVEKQR